MKKQKASNRVTVSGYSHGPEIDISGKGRHTRVLAQRFRANEIQFSSHPIIVSFFFESPGSFGFDFKQGIQRRTWVDNEVLAVDIGLCLESYEYSDERFKCYLSSLVLDGAVSLMAFAAKKRIEIEHGVFLGLVMKAVSEYLITDFNEVHFLPHEVFLRPLDEN